MSLDSKKPAANYETSIEVDESYFETWEWSKRLCLNLTKMTMSENIKPSMPKTNNANEFMVRSIPSRI